MNVGPTFANFVEDDGEFWGAYGRRTNGQFEQIEKRLKADQYSRQAHVTIWDHRLDLEDGRKDFPCTVSYTFMLRKDKLHMTTFMRSNDVLLGLGYDGFQHSRVQIAMASVLGVEVGEYRHHAVSLHIYERDFPMTERLTMSQKVPTFLPAIEGRSWHEIKEQARITLDLAEAPEGEQVFGSYPAAESMQWYIDSMRSAIEKNKLKNEEK
jgi:thymidylate synthase